MALTDDQLYKLIDNVNSYHRLVSESKGELLLNKYPNAAAAYSLRLLDGYYRGPLVRVRREGGGEGEDGVEVDVYADYNNELSLDSLVTNVSEADDTTTNPEVDNDEYNAAFSLGLQSLGEFVHDDAYDSVNAAVTATVCVWYDQANENDAKQVVATSQPKIYDSSDGLVLENGKAAIKGDGSTTSLRDFNVALSADYLICLVSKLNSAGTNMWLGTTSAGGYFRAVDTGTSVTIRHDGETGGADFDVSVGTNQLIHTGQRVGTTMHYAQNGSDNTATERATQGASFSVTCLFDGFSNQYEIDGTMQEVVIYNSDQSANRTGIEQDINNHYQIEGYTPPEPLIDLTKRLATEAGDPESEGTPAAAYSLRTLSSGYSGPLVRVRRSTDNTEVDVYADDKGAFSLLSKIEDGGDEISTGVTGGSTTKTKLYEFVYGQSCDLMVVVWYDQSGNGLDFSQTSTTNQPKIYDSTNGVSKDANNKPRMLASDQSDFLNSSINLNGRIWVFATLQTGQQSGVTSTLFIHRNGSGTNYLLIANDGNTGGISQNVTIYDLRQNGSDWNPADRNAVWDDLITTNNVVHADIAVTAWTGVNYGFGSSTALGMMPAQEFVVYTSDPSDVAGIEANIANYYGITLP